MITEDLLRAVVDALPKCGNYVCPEAAVQRAPDGGGVHCDACAPPRSQDLPYAAALRVYRAATSPSALAADEHLRGYLSVAFAVRRLRIRCEAWAAYQKAWERYYAGGGLDAELGALHRARAALVAAGGKP